MPEFLNANILPQLSLSTELSPRLSWTSPKNSSLFHSNSSKHGTPAPLPSTLLFSKVRSCYRLSWGGSRLHRTEVHQENAMDLSRRWNENFSNNLSMQLPQVKKQPFVYNSNSFRLEKFIHFQSYSLYIWFLQMLLACSTCRGTPKEEQLRETRESWICFPMCWW